jgi:hypothetical protein
LLNLSEVTKQVTKRGIAGPKYRLPNKNKRGVTLWARAKSVSMIMGLGLIILIITTIITGEIKLNNFIIFFSGGLFGLAVGRDEPKRERKN